MLNLRIIALRIIPFIVITSLAACGGSSAVVQDDITVETISGSAGGASATGLAGDGSSSSSSALNDVSDPLSTRVVYFEYDSSSLSPQGEVIVQAHARYLANSGTVELTLEGHADQRGTREYNLALGEDRAKVVANLMQALGVAAANIQTISYGEERPVSLGSDDSAWRLNRRVEILYQ